MSVIDLLFRVDEICEKYDKYDVDKQRRQNTYGDDAFARRYVLMEEDMDKALQKAEMASVEKNRAAAVSLSAEVRRLKARLMEDIPKLQKLAQKKVCWRHANVTACSAERRNKVNMKSNI